MQHSEQTCLKCRLGVGRCFSFPEKCVSCRGLPAAVSLLRRRILERRNKASCCIEDCAMDAIHVRHRDPMDVCGQMLACRKFEDVTEKILHPLADSIAAQTASFRQFHLNGKTFAIGHNACHQVADQSHRQYASYFYRMDPVLQYGMAPGGRLGNLSRFGYDLFCLADICDYRNLIRSEYYQEFFQPNHIHHVLVLAFLDFTGLQMRRNSRKPMLRACVILLRQRSRPCMG